MVVRVQGEKIQSGWKRDKRFESESGLQVLPLTEGSQMGQIEQWRYNSWRSPRRKSQC